MRVARATLVLGSQCSGKKIQVALGPSNSQPVKPEAPDLSPAPHTHRERGPGKGTGEKDTLLILSDFLNPGNLGSRGSKRQVHRSGSS